MGVQNMNMNVHMITYLHVYAIHALIHTYVYICIFDMEDGMMREMI